LPMMSDTADWPVQPATELSRRKFREAIMGTRIQLLFTVAAGAAAFFATAAIADENTVAAKITFTGTASQIIHVGRGLYYVNARDEKGTIERGGSPSPEWRGSHEWRCLAVASLIKAVWQIQRHCVETDQDDNEIVLKATSESGGQNESGTGEVMMGTGKYAGITGKIAFTCKYTCTDPLYTADCDAQVTYTYKMP
jgi:hypothetical protein